MISWKELLIISTSALVLGYISYPVFFPNYIFPNFSFLIWIFASLLALLALIVNTIGKKLVAHFYDANAEISHWHLKRYGYWRWMYFKKLFPIWVVAPLIFFLASAGSVKWLAVTTFETSPAITRERHKFSKMTEWDIALIAVGGVIFNIILAFISKLLGYDSFANWNLWFALFNLIPFSDLDGAKIFFGSRFLWVFIVIFTLAILLLLDFAGLIATIVTALLIALVILFVFYYLVERK